MNREMIEKLFGTFFVMLFYYFAFRVYTDGQVFKGVVVIDISHQQAINSAAGIAVTATVFLYLIWRKE